MKTLAPHLSDKEIKDFIAAPDPVEEIPEIMKGAYRCRPVGMFVVDMTYVRPGLTKAEYNKMIADNKKDIAEAKQSVRNYRNAQDDRTADFVQCRLDDLIQYEINIKKRIASIGKKFDGTRLQQAKQHPLTEIMEFKHGFAKCPHHADKTPSMKLYEKENRWHCFSCGKGGDAVDLVMAINSISLPEAVKMILRT